MILLSLEMLTKVGLISLSKKRKHFLPYLKKNLKYLLIYSMQEKKTEICLFQKRNQNGFDLIPNNQNEKFIVQIGLE